MSTRWTRHAAVTLTLLSLFFAFGQREAPRFVEPADCKPLSRRRVLVIGIDGVRTDALLAAGTPNIDRLITTGVFASNVDIVGPRHTGADTVSGPGWASILTGVHPDKHGIRDNSFRGANTADYPHLFLRIRQRCPDTRALSLSSWGPMHNHIVEGTHQSLDFSAEKTYATADRKIVATAIEVLEHRPIDAMFVYLANVDSTGHSRGFHPGVKPYVKAIETADAQVGELLRAVAARAKRREEEWLIVICTDHGGRALGHFKGHRYPEVRRVVAVFNGPDLPAARIEETIYLADIAPTIMRHLGHRVAPAWKWDGRAIQDRLGRVDAGHPLARRGVSSPR